MCKFLIFFKLVSLAVFRHHYKRYPHSTYRFLKTLRSIELINKKSFSPPHPPPGSQVLTCLWVKRMLNSVNSLLHFCKYSKSIRLFGSTGTIHVVFV